MAKQENIYEGNLVIRDNADAEKYKGLTKVTGNLYIYASAKLDALKSVGGYLYIDTSAKLDAPALKSVGGNLYIYASAKLDAPALKSVGGNLYIYASAKLDALKSVGGYLYIDTSAKLDAPALKSVGGNLYIYASAKLDAPALKSVGGNLYIYAKGSLVAGKLYTGGYSKFKVIDGIGCVVLSEKKQNDIAVTMCRHSKIKNQKVIGDKFYVATKGNNNAHGKTIAEATQELMFKTGSRDTSQYRGLSKDTAKSPLEWALVYRTITGACQYGTSQFIESRGTLKKKYTLVEIITLTRGQWGHERFAEFFADARKEAA